MPISTLGIHLTFFSSSVYKFEKTVLFLHLDKHLWHVWQDKLYYTRLDFERKETDCTTQCNTARYFFLKARFALLLFKELQLVCHIRCRVKDEGKFELWPQIMCLRLP